MPFPCCVFFNPDGTLCLAVYCFYIAQVYLSLAAIRRLFPVAWQSIFVLFAALACAFHFCILSAYPAILSLSYAKTFIFLFANPFHQKLWFLFSCLSFLPLFLTFHL